LENFGVNITQPIHDAYYHIIDTRNPALEIDSQYNRTFYEQFIQKKITSSRCSLSPSSSFVDIIANTSCE